MPTPASVGVVPAPEGMIDPVPTALPTPYDYRLHPAYAARLLGVALVALALLTVGVTVLVALLGWSPDVIVVTVGVALVAVLALGWWLRTRAWVLRVSADGYRVALVRGAGVREARWSQVKDASTYHTRGVPCVLLRLRDGRSTALPVSVLAMDDDAFARELQERLRAGSGIRPLDQG